MIDGACAIPLHITPRIGHEDVAVRRFFEAIDLESADNRREIRAAVPSVESPPGACPYRAVASEANHPNRVVPGRAKVINSHAWIAKAAQEAAARYGTLRPSCQAKDRHPGPPPW